MTRQLAKILIPVAIALGAFLIYRALSRYEAAELVAAVRAIPSTRLAAAGLFAALSYVCLTFFDFLALRYVGRPLPYPKVALASFTSLSLGHTIGIAALSSGAVRYRFYSRFGLSAVEVAKLIVFCGLTVGLGLATLGGLGLLMRPDLAAGLTGGGEDTVRLLGAAFLFVPLAYLMLASFLPRSLRIKGVRLAMPRLRLALAQVGIGAANFACVAACLHQLVRAFAETGYLSVAAAYVIANIASLISHVPGGVGVVETVVPLLLPGADLIGALIAFRCIYYFAPLACGVVLFSAIELLLRPRGDPLNRACGVGTAEAAARAPGRAGS